MNWKVTVIALALIVLGSAGAYLVLKGAPHQELPSDNMIMKAGMLVSDEIWSGNVLIVESVEVPAGVTLTIEPGTVVKFKHYGMATRSQGKGLVLT